MTGTEIRNKAVKITLLLVVVVVLLCTGYMMIVLNWSYSKGERIGYVQKFSEKGWLCKTWEGELQMLPVPGAIPEKFLFSVRNKAVISKINSSLGKGFRSTTNSTKVSQQTASANRNILLLTPRCWIKAEMRLLLCNVLTTRAVQ
jgi:hypothetical protein